VTLHAGKELSQDIPKAPARPRPAQPQGRQPTPRQAEHAT
jgi:hypothetical protein